MVVWFRGTANVDAALLRVESGAGWEAFTPGVTQRWGFLIGAEPHPVSMLQGGASTPGLARQVDGRLEVVGTETKATRWSRMSGAAVLADDGLLLGVARHAPQSQNSAILTATPVRALLADAEFCKVLTEHGVGVRAEPVEPTRLLTPVSPPPMSGSPAALLRADAEAVPFTGRDRELDDLLAWCHGGPAGLSVRVVTGPAGQGKSRLARRFATLIEADGWVSGNLRSDMTDFETPEEPPGFGTLRTESPLLLVVDHAETRPGRVRAVLAELSGTGHQVRVLLLARSDGPWRVEGHEAAPQVRDLLNHAEVTTLRPLYAPRPSEADVVEPTWSA
jgi:hypothetical protein